MAELRELVARSLRGDVAPEFEERVERQAEDLRRAIDAGLMDSSDFAVGMELEVYAVGDDCHLVRLPEAVFEGTATKELGLHNAEINTDPDVLDGDGVATQAGNLEDDFAAARERARDHGRDLVLDSMWTLPPAEGSASYLGSVDRSDGVTVAENMRANARYVALDNDTVGTGGGSVTVSVPGAEHTFPTILFESLATSIQPHLQVPSAAAFPRYYNAAIRTLGPVLALSTNSPFLPPDLYDDVENPLQVVEETHHELRIHAFEQPMNQTPDPKVRVPADLETAADVVDRVAEDALYAPFLREWVADGERETFTDRHWEFDYKRATYWRWLRCVIGGEPVAGISTERSLRIEYRPIPTQPTIRDVLGMQFLVVGLIRGLGESDHPITDLPWEAARRSFYGAVEDGLDADLAWVTAAGERTSEREVIYDELFEYARRGLDAAGVPDAAVDMYLDPIETRWAERTTPSDWKRRRVREGLAEGRDLTDAIEGMQRTYIELSRGTDTFTDWL